MSEALILEHASQTDTDFLVYTGNFCGYCRALKNLLNRNQLTYTEFNFDDHAGMRRAVIKQQAIEPSPWSSTFGTNNRCSSVGLTKQTATLGKGREPFFQGLMVLDRNHVPLGVFDQLDGPTCGFKQMGDGPTVLNGHANVLFTVHPKHAFGLKF